jgi:hypothetical protein
MLMCDCCDRAYHFSCVGLDELTAEFVAVWLFASCDDESTRAELTAKIAIDTVSSNYPYDFAPPVVSQCLNGIPKGISLVVDGVMDGAAIKLGQGQPLPCNQQYVSKPLATSERIFVPNSKANKDLRTLHMRLLKSGLCVYWRVQLVASGGVEFNIRIC